MVDMNTGMPFYWYQPVGPTPAQNFAAQDAANAARLSQSATNTVNSNNQLANQTFQQGQDDFWKWSNNATKLNAAYVASNLAIGNARPVGTYNGNALSPFATGTAPIQHLGGTNGLQKFNEGSYLMANPDVFKAGADPWQHYNQFGQNEGRQGAWDTTSSFNSSNYLANNPDVFKAGADPYQHWLMSGYDEGRTGGFGGPDFNEQNYLANNPDVYKAGMDPTAHWLQFGSQEGRKGGWGENPFNTSNYLANNPDVFKAGADPIQHWLQYGQQEGRQGGWGENPFNAQAYSQHNPDVAAAGMDPMAHWMQFGQQEGRQGGWGNDTFNPQEYLLQNRDVAAAGADPLQHWMNFGYKEGREAAFGGTEASDWDSYFNTATQGGGGANTGRDALAAEYYLGNQDVFNAAKASNQDPTQFAFDHFLNYGQNEGRSLFDANDNSDPYFDTVGYFSAHPEAYKAFLSADNQYTDPTAFAEMSNYQSPSNDYNTFQKGPSYNWQSSMPQGRNDPRVINAIYKSAGETGLHPAVIAAILNMESVWNPTNRTGEQYGLAQMSGDMWGDNPFNGTMGGVDFNTYKNDTVGDKQIGAYTDWLIRGNKLNRNGIDVASVDDPVMQAAMLQAIQFAGNSADWRTALAQGNMDTYVTTKHPQAKELRPGGEAYPTINSMYNAYDRILGGWMR